MKTLYALALICLSVPAFADFDNYSMETGYRYDVGADFSFADDENTATIVAPATPKSEDYSLEPGLSLDDETAYQDENTATIVAPATPKSEDYPLELGLGLDNETAYQDDTVYPDAIPADIWF
jgi:hypothetical protein